MALGNFSNLDRGATLKSLWVSRNPKLIPFKWVCLQPTSLYLNHPTLNSEVTPAVH